LRSWIIVVVLGILGLCFIEYSKELAFGEAGLSAKNPLRIIQYVSFKWLGILFVGAALGYSYTKAANPVIDQQDWALLLFPLLLTPAFDLLGVDVWVWALTVMTPSILVFLLKHSMESIKKFLSEN